MPRQLWQHMGLLAVAVMAPLLVTALPAAAAGTSAGTAAPGRKLLQPFTLGLSIADRKTSNAGRAREGRIVSLSNGLVNGLVDTSPSVNDAIRSRVTQRTASSNLDFGGAFKSTFQGAAETDRNNGRTDSFTDTRTIAQPGVGLTASKAIDASGSISQKRIKDAAPANSPAPGPPPPVDGPSDLSGPNDDRPLGSWEVLLSGVTDYGWAGDYDYSLVEAIVDDETGVADDSTYDYDYGQLRPIPETSVVKTKTRTHLDDDAGRAASFGRTATAATAYQAIARQEARTTGLWGTSAARQNDDVFGTTPVFIPPNPFRQSGTTSAGAALGRSYKGSLPSTAVNEGNAGTTVSRNYITGGAADQLNYAAGTKSTMVRSENVALGGQENIDFDVGRRHHRHRRAQRRRLQAADGSGSGSSSSADSSSKLGIHGSGTSAIAVNP